MFNYDQPTIREIHDDLEELIALQKSIAEDFATEIKKVQSEKDVTTQELRVAVKALIPAGDAQRYEDITRAAKEAGAEFDCAALVKRWTKEDETNRAERAALEAQWGTRAQVAEKAAREKETLDVTTQALGEISTEVTEFDKTTANIKAHNAKYPKNQITEESHDGYENTNALRWLGYWTVRPWWGGAHAAYLALGTYTKDNRDYYEYATEVATMRKTQEGLQTQAAEQQRVYEEIAGVSQRMGHLDSAYRGPEGIAREVRSMVSDFLVKDDDFALILNDHMKSAEARAIAVAVAKIRTFDLMTEDLGRQHKHASDTTADLNRPMETLEGALSRVGNERIDFNMEAVEQAVNKAVKISRATIREAQATLQSVDGYDPAPGTTFFEMERELRALGKMEFKSNALDLNFSDLEDMVGREVRAYEREQQRQREAAERAAREARERMKDAFEQASQTRSKRSGGGLGVDFGRSSGPSISIGRTGIGSSGPGSVSGGSRGIGSSVSSGVSRGRRGIG